MTVYLVDEDYYKFEAWILELELRGYQVQAIGDADRAYEILCDADDVELIIIDVMLSSRPDESSRYPEDRTDDNLITGLVLVKDLLGVRRDVVPSRTALLTNTSNDDTWAEAEGLADDLGIRLLEKNEFPSAMQFGDAVVELVEAELT